MFITRNKLFRFRSSVFSAKKTIATKFPVKMRRASNKRALQTTISSARDGKYICAGDESVVRLLLLLDLTVVDIFFILVRIESVVVVGCNLFITQKIWKKKLLLKTLARVSAECIWAAFWRGSTLKASVNFNPAFYARLVLIQSATLSLGTGAMLWERIWNEMLFQMDKWPTIQQVHERILTSTIVFLLLFYCYHFLKRVQRR